MAFDSNMHAALIEEGEEQSLSPENKKIFARWEKEFARDKKRCMVLRFVPALKQFYEGGVMVTLWPGRSAYDPVSGRQHITPSDHLDIKKDGYVPKSREEALRLLFLSQNPQNHICLWEKRQLDLEAKGPEMERQRLADENARLKEEMEELRKRLKG